MKRWFLAVGVLLGGALSVAHAEYLRIIYNLSAVNEDAKNGTPGGPNDPNGPRMPVPPGPRPPGVNPGGPPGAPPGNPRGGPPRGGDTAPPSRPPRQPGNPRQPGTPGQPGNLPPWLSNLLSSAPEDDEPIQAEVVVEYSKADKAVKLRGNNGVVVPFATIHHKWGKTGLLADLKDIRVEFVRENGVNLPPVLKRFHTQREEMLKGGKTPENLLNVAEWALTHYLLEQFTEAIEEIRQLDSQDPAVTAFDYYTAEMKKRVGPDDNETVWKSKVTTNKVKLTDHYALLYSARDEEPEEVKDYARRLEDNYRAFFYWFALKAKDLKGRRLKVPERRLVAILLDKPNEFKMYREAFDHAAMGGDGFYSRRENLAVFSAHRLDEVYNLLEQATKPLWQTGWNQEDLLHGGGHIGAQPDEIIRNQMLALLLRAMRDESALATVSHVASQQLVVATGLLPRNVEVPEWIEFGMGSFFETPKGAFWPGIGAPSWRYLVKYKVWRKTQLDAQEEAKKKAEEAKKNPGQRPPENPPQTPPQTPPQNPNQQAARNSPLDPATEAIRSVITDKYFREVRAEQKREDRLVLTQGKARSLELKARTMAWGLTYFLMNRKPEYLMRYFDELNKLPRDMDFDDETLLMTFGRAFDMVSDTNTGTPVLDNAKLDKLAEEWYSFLDYTNIESSEAMQDAVKQYQERRKKSPAAQAPNKSWKDYIPKELPKAPTPRPRR